MAQPFFLECKNDDSKQSEMRLIRIVTTLYVQHTFFAFFFAVTARLRRGNVNLTFYRGRKQATTIFSLSFLT